MKKIIIPLMLIVTYFIFSSCIHTELIYIKLRKDPRIKVKPNSTLVINNFWSSYDEKDSTFRPEKEISQKFRDIIEREQVFKVLDRKSYDGIERIIKNAEEEKAISVISYLEKQNPDWRFLTNDEPCDYLMLGETSFEVLDGSGYEYRRVYDPFSRSYKYKEVFVKQQIFNIQVKLVLIDIKNNKKIYEDTYNDSKKESTEDSSNLEQFLRLSEYSVERFLLSLKPEEEIQYRYLLGR
ncbi:MAG: hypothetical protein PHV06_11620 [bacterium]|nr:hypothetical protein [bacterium]